MTLLGLLLLMTLIAADAEISTSHQENCDDCNHSGRWWPLFKPSQIISSEFPEHRAQSRESHGSLELTQGGSPVVTLGSREAATSRVRTSNGHGQRLVEWDHYGSPERRSSEARSSADSREPLKVSLETGGASRSVSEEARGGLSRSSVEGGETTSGHRTPPNSLETVESIKDDMSNSLQDGLVRQKNKPQQHINPPSQEAFFDDGNFFDDKPSSSGEHFPGDFDVSKESSDDPESNSVEFSGSREGFGRFHKGFNFEKPVATSYSSISSVFRSRPILRKDLLHPDLSYNDIPQYIQEPAAPVGPVSPYVRTNMAQQYLVHESPEENTGVLRIDHDTSSRSSSANLPRDPFIPMDHPVYRYVKDHGGVRHRPPPLRWEDIHPQLRHKFPFSHLRKDPYVKVQSHQSLVHHVLPTKDPFSDNFWKESKKIVDLKPPPLGQTLYYFKKKPNLIDLKKFGRRRDQGNKYVYFVQNKKKLRN